MTQGEQWLIGILSTIGLFILGMWRDLRHRQETQHVENVTRLTRIETAVEPIVKWWNNGNGHDDH